MSNRESKMVTLRMEDGKATVWCDPEIADLVDVLNTDKLATIASCSGHGHRPGSIALKDGRWLFVATEDQRQAIEATFPLDVNGKGRPDAHPARVEALIVAQHLEEAYSWKETEVRQAVKLLRELAALSTPAPQAREGQT